MIVIRHDAPRVHLPPGLFAGFSQTFEKRQLGPLVANDVRAIVAAIYDVVNRPFVLQS